MARKHYNKLVRDRIPEIIHAEGRECATEIMPEAEYRQALLTKLLEEAQEVAQAAPDELIKELADVYEVIDAILALNDIDEQIVRDRQQQRRSDRGGFAERIKLLWAE
jgi:predicted house-cleaning noncanonical NTP pyrophosphatase (MazG superfamily)